MKVKVEALRAKILNTLSNFDRDEAEKIADYLIWADMSGIKTQGVIKLTGTEPLQNIKPKHEI